MQLESFYSWHWLSETTVLLMSRGCLPETIGGGCWGRPCQGDDVSLHMSLHTVAVTDCRRKAAPKRLSAWWGGAVTHVALFLCLICKAALSGVALQLPPCPVHQGRVGEQVPCCHSPMHAILLRVLCCGCTAAADGEKWRDKKLCTQTGV